MWGDEELIGDPLIGETNFYQSTTGELRARYRVELVETGSMYYRVGYSNPWGWLTTKNNECDGDAVNHPEMHDVTGDGVPEAGAETHCLPNGAYTVKFHRRHWLPDGSGTDSDSVLFTRRVAMLDTLGSEQHDPSAPTYQDVRVRFSLDSVATGITGSLRGADFYLSFNTFSDTSYFRRAPFSTTMGVGDTLWLASTYRATGGPDCVWCNNFQGVLAAFNQDYLYDPAGFGYATNSVPAENSTMPKLHSFAVASGIQPFRVVARVTEPYQNGTSNPGRVQQDTIFVTVVGLNASFTVSGSPIAGQPVTFNGSGSEGFKPLEYRWDFGDQTPPTSWSAADSIKQHMYSSPGTYTASLWVRRTSSTAPTDSASQPVSVGGSAPVVVVIEGVDIITASGTYEWHALATGGVPPYHYQWYYRRSGQAEQPVGSDSPWYSRYVSVAKTAYAFRLRNVVTDAAQQTDQAVHWVDVLPGGGGGLLSVGLLAAGGSCVALPADRERRRAAHEAVVAGGSWPVPCRVP